MAAARRRGAAVAGAARRLRPRPAAGAGGARLAGRAPPPLAGPPRRRPGGPRRLVPRRRAAVPRPGRARGPRQCRRVPSRYAPLGAADHQQRARADELAERASHGEMALFLGAGVSASAGLPLWGELLDLLARQAGMDDRERDDLQKLNPLDQAGVIEKRLGGPEGLREAVRGV